MSARRLSCCQSAFSTEAQVTVGTSSVAPQDQPSIGHAMTLRTRIDLPKVLFPYPRGYVILAIQSLSCQVPA